jgi:hypothetical protein
VYRFSLASGHESPEKIAMEAAGWLVEEDSNDTISFPGDHEELLIGNENAIPGYDNTYNPIPVSSPGSSATYSPGNVGPIRRL